MAQFGRLMAATPLTLTDLEAENRRLRALLQFGRAATSERELRPLLALVCEQLTSSLGWSAALVALRDSQQDRLELVEAVGLPWATVEGWQRIAAGASPSAARTELGEAVRRREVSVYPDLLVDPHLEDVRDILLEAGLRRALALPLVSADGVLGVAVAYHRSPGYPADQDVDTSAALAEQAAIAIGNARVYGEMRERLAEVTRLQTASSVLVEELHPERALLVVAQQALAMAGAATVSIELLRDGGDELEVQVAVGEDARALASMRVAVDGSLSGAAVATGRPQVARAPFESAARLAGVAGERTTARSLLVLPLRARGRIVGTLSAYSPEPDAFQARAVDLLATFANQAAMTLDNARLYGELHSRLEEMVGLQRVGTLLLEEHDFDRVLHAICRQLQRLTDAGGVGLALLEDDPNYLELRTVVGPSAEVLRGARIPIAGSFAGEALRTNRPQRSDDALHDERGYRRSLMLGNTRTLLSVPMKTRQRTVGVLSVYNKQGQGGFTDRDSELATFFANQAAAAIENARLYEATREYAVVEERNRLARELHDSVTQSLFSVTLLSQAALSLWDRDPAKARERLERAHEVAQGALAEMRALIFQLRPVALQEEGLVSALEKHLAALHSRHNRVVELRISGEERRLSAGVEEAALRIVQESLNNVLKHARASTARVELDFRSDCLRVCTTDDGVGFDPAEPPSGTMGMSSMRERAQAMGGDVRIESRPGEGTRVVAELPVRDAEEGV